jgi:adenosylcobinamide-phosphate synthase
LPLLLSAILLKSVLAYRGLRRRVAQVAAALGTGNLAEARRLLSRHLVSRNTANLPTGDVAGAAIESLAENITDGVTAPLLAYAVGGMPAAWGYRLANTADAMWGYRTPEFEQLGKFAARLDDALNWLPARLTGWLLVAAAWLTGENAGQAARVMWQQHNQTSSPNAGWTMGAVAGALGITLSKQGLYTLSGGPRPPDVAAIRRALRLADAAVALFTAALAAVLVVLSRRQN